MKPECERIEPMLSAYVDGELTGTDLQEVEAHLSDCADCRGVAEQFRDMDGLYSDLACQQPTDGRWKQMLWNVLPRAEVPQEMDAHLTAGPRRIPMNISEKRPTRWAGVTAGVLALAGMVLVVVMLVFRPGERGTKLGPLSADNTVLIVELDSTSEDYEVGLQLPADVGDLLVVDVTRAEDIRSESI